MLIIVFPLSRIPGWATELLYKAGNLCVLQCFTHCLLPVGKKASVCISVCGDFSMPSNSQAFQENFWVSTSHHFVGNLIRAVTALSLGVSWWARGKVLFHAERVHNGVRLQQSWHGRLHMSWSWKVEKNNAKRMVNSIRGWRTTLH